MTSWRPARERSPAARAASRRRARRGRWPAPGSRARSWAASYRRCYRRRAMASDTISFARGAPSADILPVEAVRKAVASALESDWEKALSYGTGIGHPGLCEWVAREFHGLEGE